LWIPQQPHLQVKLDNPVCHPVTTIPAGQATDTCESSSGHCTCRPSYRHLWILQWPLHLQAKLQTLVNPPVATAPAGTCPSLVPRTYCSCAHHALQLSLTSTPGNTTYLGS
jgi:hypothetical protein